MRIIIAGILGAIAMFVWTALAHTVTPLAEIGVGQLPGEEIVVGALHGALGDRSGLYLFPGGDMSAPDAQAKHAAAVAAGPSGLLVYNKPGTSADMAPMLAKEFAKQLAQAILAAFLLSMTVLAGFGMRVSFVALLGLFATLETNVSYMIWYGFPLDYTLAQIALDVIGAIFAGVAIAFWLGRKPA